MKYYNIKRMKNSKAQYKIIYGGRSTGKSYAMAGLLLDNYLDTGKQFVRLIKTLTQAKGLETYFREVMDNDPEKYKDITLEYEFPYYKINGEVFGYVISLSIEHNWKSVQFPDVNIMLLEEFVSPSVKDYVDADPALEIGHFIRIISTVFRTRKDGTVYLIGNSENISNPYFEFLRVDGASLKLGDFKEFQLDAEIGGKTIKGRGARVAVEYVPEAFEDVSEIPLMLRIPGNDIALTGEIADSPSVISWAVPVVRRSGAYSGLYINRDGLPDNPENWLVFRTTFPDCEDVFDMYINRAGELIITTCDPSHNPRTVQLPFEYAGELVDGVSYEDKYTQKECEKFEELYCLSGGNMMGSVHCGNIREAIGNKVPVTRIYFTDQYTEYHFTCERHKHITLSQAVDFMKFGEPVNNAYAFSEEKRRTIEYMFGCSVTPEF